MASQINEEGDKYRSYIYGEGEKNTQWRFGAPPNYDVVNKLFEEGRTQIWPPGSLEEKVQNLVKTYEMELVHKVRAEDIKSVDTEKFTFSVNGRKPINREEITRIGGSYNAFLQTSLPEKLRIFDPAQETGDSANKAFTTTFPRGFALEILQVYAGPPVIAYKFRHWAYMEGPFKGHSPTGDLVEFYGIGIFTLDEKNKIIKVEFFYDRGELLADLLQGDSVDGSTKDAISSCPFMSHNA